MGSGLRFFLPILQPLGGPIRNFAIDVHHHPRLLAALFDRRRPEPKRKPARALLLDGPRAPLYHVDEFVLLKIILVGTSQELGEHGIVGTDQAIC
jgi:hypothetical protein